MRYIFFIYNHSLLFKWETLSGYSSGSAGGSVLGESTNAMAMPAPVTPRNTMPPSSPPRGSPQACAKAAPPAPMAPPPDPLQSQAADLEAQLKSRMEAHAKSLEKALTDDFLEKKRKAEEDLDEEIRIKRDRRMRELEEDLKEEHDMREARLAGLDAQLIEKMQLVADEQTLLDDLKEKAANMQRRLDEEAMKATPVAAPPDASKSNLKDRLREKLELTQKKNTANQAISVATPTPPQVKGTPSPSPALPTPPSTSPNDAVVPMMPVTDMRFTSSTHPAAWQFLYRLTRKPDQCDTAIYEAWHAGAFQLLKKNDALFVTI